ncbi:hypothetical protein L218DRAFT_42635 [Marasmius fiardii PR-910]|nr:hypothetical protein L218DRAFT_42635 [Marasmius fiardii PR-910]
MPLPTGNLYENFLIHGCLYRHIDDLSTLWLPSPTVLPRELNDEDEAAMAVKITPYSYSSDAASSVASSFSLVSSASGPSHTATQVEGLTSGKSTKERRLSYTIKKLLGVNRRSYLSRDNGLLASDSHERHVEQRDNTPSPSLPNVFTGWKGPFPKMSPGVEIVPLSDWKAWGYYVSPFVNGVFVKNHCEYSPYSFFYCEVFQDEQ